MTLHAMTRYVDVLDQRVQHTKAETGQAQARLRNTQKQLARLKSMGLTAELKKTTGNVALHVNAAGFRSGLMEMAEQCRDACGVQQLEWAQAQHQMQHAMRRHSSMQSVLSRTQAQLVQSQNRQAQKVMDEMAGQAWMRQVHGHKVTQSR
jgi:flagellar export protein FliJ